jgi:glucose-fructose oxidoreductase
MELTKKGKLGTPRFFTSSFSFNIPAPNSRLDARDKGGGPLYDIGIYCINAARMLFRDEPTEVVALAARAEDERFSAVEEQVSAVLRFPGEKLAAFTVGFGAAWTGWHEIVGDKGVLRADPAYAFLEPLAHELTVGDKKTKRKRFKRHDQVGAELDYFSDCVLDERDPEPSGEEGLADVRVIRALYRSIDERRPIRLEAFERSERPAPEQEKKKPAPRTEPPKADVQPEH